MKVAWKLAIVGGVLVLLSCVGGLTMLLLAPTPVPEAHTAELAASDTPAPTSVTEEPADTELPEPTGEATDARNPAVKPSEAPAPTKAPDSPKPKPTKAPTPTPSPTPEPPAQVPAKVQIHGNYVPFAQCDHIWWTSHTVGWGGTSTSSQSFNPELEWSYTIDGPKVNYYLCG